MVKMGKKYKKGTIKVGDHILEPVDDKDVPAILWESIERVHVNEAIAFLSEHPQDYNALKREFDFNYVDKKIFLNVAEKDYGKTARERLEQGIWG